MFVLKYQEKISNFFQNQSTWLTLDVPRNNLQNDNEIFHSQDASWSFTVYGLDWTAFFKLGATYRK
jgi:hypothetical protein